MSRLVCRQLEHEVEREAGRVALDGSHERARFDPVQDRKVCIEQDAFATQEQDPVLDMDWGDG